MNRLTLTLTSFLAGAVTITGAVMYADGRAAFMFVIGAAAVLIAQAALLGSAARIHRAGLVMIRFAEATSDRKAKHGKGAPEKQERATAITDRSVIDIQSALVNFGCKREKALKIAQDAAAAGGDLKTMLRRALSNVGSVAA